MCGLFCKGDTMNNIYLNELEKIAISMSSQRSGPPKARPTFASPTAQPTSYSQTTQPIGNAKVNLEGIHSIPNTHAEKVEELVNKANGIADIVEDSTKHEAQNVVSPKTSLKRYLKPGLLLAGSALLTYGAVKGYQSMDKKASQEDSFGRTLVNDSKIGAGVGFGVGGLLGGGVGLLATDVRRLTNPKMNKLYYLTNGLIGAGMMGGAAALPGAVGGAMVSIPHHAGKVAYRNLTKEAFAKSLLEQGYSVEDTLALIKEAKEKDNSYGATLSNDIRTGARLGFGVGGLMGGGLGLLATNAARAANPNLSKLHYLTSGLLGAGVVGGATALPAAVGGAMVSIPHHAGKVAYRNLTKEAYVKDLLEQGYSVEDTLALVKRLIP